MNCPSKQGSFRKKGHYVCICVYLCYNVCRSSERRKNMMKQKNVMQIPDVYKPSEFAKIAGVSVNTLQRWDREGRLTAYRTPAGRRYYTRKHVIEIKHSTPQEEEAWMKDEATLNLWLSPYPLKWLENGGVSRASRIGDEITTLLPVPGFHSMPCLLAGTLPSHPSRLHPGQRSMKACCSG